MRSSTTTTVAAAPCGDAQRCGHACAQELLSLGVWCTAAHSLAPVGIVAMYPESRMLHRTQPSAHLCVPALRNTNPACCIAAQPCTHLRVLGQLQGSLLALAGGGGVGVAPEQQLNHRGVACKGHRCHILTWLNNRCHMPKTQSVVNFSYACL